MKIDPTVGRVVWYHRGARAGFTGHHYEDQPLAAHVAYVNADGTVNLMVVSAHGVPFGVMNVPLVQDGEPVPADAEFSAGWAEWMPYQKGQAAKTEALQQQLADPVEDTEADPPPMTERGKGKFKPVEDTEGA